MGVQPCGAGSFRSQGDSKVVFRALQTNRLPLSGRRTGRRCVSTWTLCLLCTCWGWGSSRTGQNEWKLRSREMSGSEGKGQCWGLGSQRGAVGTGGWMDLLSKCGVWGR